MKCKDKPISWLFDLKKTLLGCKDDMVRVIFNDGDTREGWVSKFELGVSDVDISISIPGQSPIHTQLGAIKRIELLKIKVEKVRTVTSDTIIEEEEK